MELLTKNKAQIPALIAAILSLVMILTIFLPYGVANENHAERLRDYSDYYSVEELDMTGEDLINMSMVKLARMYSTMSEEMFGDSWGVFYVVIVVLIAVFGLCSLLFALLKKPIAVIIFSLLSFGVFCLENFDYSDRGIIPGKNYEWGIAYYVFFVVFAMILASAIWLLVSKIIEKRKQNA